MVISITFWYINMQSVSWSVHACISGMQKRVCKLCKYDRETQFDLQPKNLGLKVRGVLETASLIELNYYKHICIICIHVFACHLCMHALISWFLHINVPECFTNHHAKFEWELILYMENGLVWFAFFFFMLHLVRVVLFSIHTKF